MNQPLQLCNLTAATWTASYRVGASDIALVIPADSSVLVVAEAVQVGSAWETLAGPSVYTSDDVLALQFPPDGSGAVVSVITVLLGALCAFQFWQQANPLRK